MTTNIILVWAALILLSILFRPITRRQGVGFIFILVPISFVVAGFDIDHLLLGVLVTIGVVILGLRRK